MGSEIVVVPGVTGSSSHGTGATVATRPQPTFGAADWLNSFQSPHTREAYERDARVWFEWCITRGLDPREAIRPDVEAWGASLTDAGYAPSTVARKIAAVSSLYRYAESLDLVRRNPAERVRRPRVSVDHLNTPALTDDEAAALLRAARRPRELPRTAIGVEILLTLGLRISEMVNANVEDLSVDRGHRVITFTRKGGERGRLPIPPELAAGIDSYLDGRTSGPLLATATGRRVDRQAWRKTVKRLAVAAGIAAGEKIGPHACRRTVVTSLLDAGVPLRHVQKIVGHKDPRTTERYDKSVQGLTRNSAYLNALAARFGATSESPPSPAA